MYKNRVGTHNNSNGRISSMEKIILYTNGCPKCNVLKTKLNQKNVSYNESNDFSELEAQGIQSLPVLKVNEEYMPFLNAVNWVNSLEGKN